MVTFNKDMMAMLQAACKKTGMDYQTGKKIIDAQFTTISRTIASGEGKSIRFWRLGRFIANPKQVKYLKSKDD